MNADSQKSLVVGKTYQEVKHLPQTILALSNCVALEKIVCILDQHMEYAEGTVLGTDIIKEVRSKGFEGLMFIRSANEDFEAVQFYKTAGATGHLTKGCDVRTLASTIKQQYHRASRILL